jgi:hypothetical protein
MQLLKKNKFEFIFRLFWLLIFTLFISCGDKKTDELKEKYHCDSFEDCLSKNEFDGAYAFYSLKKQEVEQDLKNQGLMESYKMEIVDVLNKNYKQLISAQFSFWVKQKNFETAFNVLQEFNFEAKYNLNTVDEDENVRYNEEVSFYNNLLDTLINKMIVESQPKKILLLYCKSFKPIVIGDAKNKGILGGFNSYLLSDQPYKLAITKVNELKK